MHNTDQCPLLLVMQGAVFISKLPDLQLVDQVD